MAQLDFKCSFEVTERLVVKAQKFGLYVSSAHL